MNECKSFNKRIDLFMRHQLSYSFSLMIIWVGDHPGKEVIFIQRFYREIHLIFVSITNPHNSPPHPPPPSSPLQSLLFCHPLRFLLLRSLSPFLICPPPPLGMGVGGLGGGIHTGFQSRLLAVYFPWHLGVKWLPKDIKNLTDLIH